MKIEIRLDEAYEEPEVVVYTSRMTDEVSRILKKLSDESGERNLVGFEGEQLRILRPEELIRVYAEKQKVFAQTEQTVCSLRIRLYEAETLLGRDFVRISHSEIINLNQVLGMDLSFSGTIGVNLSGGVRTFVSRRYVARIKQRLGI